MSTENKGDQVGEIHPMDAKLCCMNHVYDPEVLAAQRAQGHKEQKAQPFEPKVTPHPAIVALEQEMIQNRNHFHRNPELAFKEVDTAAYVAKQLRSYSDNAITVVEQVGRTGVVGFINGTGPAHPGFKAHCIMFRADMDALPIQELATPFNAEYRSERPNTMHACGHDGHMSMLLAAAKVIASPEYRATIPSNLTVKLCFQPAEEDQGGAKAMINDGILDASASTGPAVDEVYGIHLWSYAPLGQVQTRLGPMMAASDRFYITVKGSGGHGAVPQGTKDAIVCAAHLVTQLQTIVSRNVAPLDAAVVTVGTFNAGYTLNIIADRADLSGTVRSLKRDVQKILQQRMQELCDGAAKSFGCEVILRFLHGYPATINGPQSAVDVVSSAAKEVVGSDESALILDATPTMGAEDFAFFLNARPGCFYFVGANPDGQLDKYPHHKSSFDFNPKALTVGASVTLRILEQTPERIAKEHARAR